MDAARAAAMSDPLHNPQFRRAWTAPPLEKERPLMAATIQGAQDTFGNSRNSANIEKHKEIQGKSQGVADGSP